MLDGHELVKAAEGIARHFPFAKVSMSWLRLR